MNDKQGMATVTLTAWLPQLHPSACTKQELDLGHCRGPSQTQLGFLLLGLGFLSIGTGGIRPCSIPFGVDQFDPTTDQGRKGINSFFNWYYTTFTIVLLITQTVVVYIQDNLSWVVGFGIPTILMACSIALFFIGMSLYNHAKPEGSMFSSIFQVFVAAYKKRRIILDPTDDIIGADDHHDHKVVFYDPPVKGSVLSKLSRTNQYRYLYIYIYIYLRTYIYMVGYKILVDHNLLLVNFFVDFFFFLTKLKAPRHHESFDVEIISNY